MKQLLSLNQDHIIETKFVADVVKNKKSGKNEPIWTDDSKKKAKGKHRVDNVYVHIQQYDNQGYGTNSFQRVYLYKKDVLALAERIKEIESIECEDALDNDLPY